MDYPALILSDDAPQDLLRTLVDTQTLVVADTHNQHHTSEVNRVIMVTEQRAEHIQEVKDNHTYDRVVAVGGCTVLDFGRACAVGKEFIALPTILSHACLSTNRSVINYNGTYRTEITVAPVKTIVSVPAVIQSHVARDGKWTAAGFGDLFSALSASIEFEYAGNERSFEGIDLEQVIANVPLCWEALVWIAGLPEQQTLDDELIIKRLAYYLHESSVDVLRNNHTRLNAASEHKLYYELQEQQHYDKGLVTHGELVWVGTLVTAAIFAQETGNHEIQDMLRAVGRRLSLPLHYDELAQLGVSREQLTAALYGDRLAVDCLYRDYLRTPDGEALLDDILASPVQQA